MSDKKHRIIEQSQHEKKIWGDIFRKELEKENPPAFSSYWWECYYTEISELISGLLKDDMCTSVLEAGSGSGKATLLTVKNAKITLLDISPEALEAGKRLAHQYNVDDVNYVEGNMFSMPFGDECFDFVWNIGTVEHYDQELAVDMLGEMLRVTKKNGYCAFGIPNSRSLPIKKASLLAHPKLSKFLGFIPGYRLDSEKFYTPKDMKKMLTMAAESRRIAIDDIDIIYLGSPMLVGSPKFLIDIVARISQIFYYRKFLIMAVVKRNKGTGDMTDYKMKEVLGVLKSEK